MDRLKDVFGDARLQQVKSFALTATYCVLIWMAGCTLFNCICLTMRYMRLKLGSRIKIDSKRALLITGSTSGIGLSLAKRYFRKGFSVFATYYNSSELGFAELQQLITATGSTYGTGPKLFLVHMDVRSRASIDTAAMEIEQLLEEYQLELYSVVSNAGVSCEVSLEFCETESILQMIETNILGPILVCRRFIKHIIQSKGRIIIVSSVIYNLKAPHQPIYFASKAALKSFSDSLNECLKNYGASCRCVCPGNFLNQSNIILPLAKSFQDSVSKLSDEERELFRKNIEENEITIDKVLKQRLRFAECNNEDPEQLLAAYGLTKPSDNSGYVFTRFNTCLDWLFATFVAGRKDELNEKEMSKGEIANLHAFDTALLLRNPPQRLYPGSSLFEHVVAPGLMEYSSQIAYDILYKISERGVRGKI